MTNPQSNNCMAELLARAWRDDDFRQRLLSDPENTLRDEGINIPPRAQSEGG